MKRSVDHQPSRPTSRPALTTSFSGLTDDAKTRALMEHFPPGWVVYMLECEDGSLYTGSTNDLGNRLRTHQSGRGAKYTRSHVPVRLVHVESCANQSAALRRENAIKNLPRPQKDRLIKPK